MDKAHSETDKMLEQMERELTTIYSNAHANVQKEWLEYMESASDELAELQEAYDKAKKAGDMEAQRRLGRELRAMKKEYTVQNDRYRQVVERTALELANVNEIAKVRKNLANNFQSLCKTLKIRIVAANGYTSGKRVGNKIASQVRILFSPHR